jgi:hypothetical protein
MSGLGEGERVRFSPRALEWFGKLSHCDIRKQREMRGTVLTTGKNGECIVQWDGCSHGVGHCDAHDLCPSDGECRPSNRYDAEG